MKQIWYVYIIRTQSGLLYTGITTNLARRFKEHLSVSGKGAKFFSVSPPEELVYKQRTFSRSKASKIEARIKRLPRSEKLALLTMKSASCRPAPVAPRAGQQ